MQKVIEDHLPDTAPEHTSLLRRTKEMKLPENPLVRSFSLNQTSHTAVSPSGSNTHYSRSLKSEV